MFATRKTIELAVCLLGYWLGKGVGGWGGGIVLAFAGLCATSYGWEYAVRSWFGENDGPTGTMNFVYGAASSLVVLAAAYMLWGK